MQPLDVTAWGSYQLSDEGGGITGWVTPAEVTGRPQLAILCGESIVHLVEAAEETPVGAPLGALGFSWSIPDLLRCGPGPIKIIDLVRGDELDGPSQLSPAVEPVGVSTVWAREPSFWPHGLTGSLDRWFNHVAEGLWLDVDPTAVGARFARSDSPPRAPGLTWGVRLTAENEIDWVTHHSLVATLAESKEGEVLRVWIRLTQATSNFTQRRCEIFLSHWDGQRFKRLRRLRNGRVLRRFSFLDVVVLLDPDERELATAGRLKLTVSVKQCAGVVVCPPLSAPTDAVGVRFEDGRLEGAFADTEQLTRILDVTTGPALLLKSQDSSRDPTTADSPETAFTDIIVPVYNGHDTVIRCLRSIQENTDTPCSVLIVDDGSREYTTRLLDRIVAEDPRFRIHRRAVNRGYTKSINEAVKLTDADWVVIINSDTVVSQGWLEKLHCAARTVPNAGLIGPLSNAASWQSVPFAKNSDGTWSQNDFIGPEIIDRVQDKIEAASECAYPSLPLLNGFCTLIARSVFDTVGLFDEEAFPQGYGEESDFCFRAALAGFKLIVADNCFVYHEKSASFGSATRSRLTRSGNFELKNKHPGINIAAVEQLMQKNPAMLRLRSQLENLELELQN